LRRLISVIVPFWHVPMLNDADRNAAFEGAIRAIVARKGPFARVLYIGTGSGLLSMTAARAGAQNIVACERVPLIAETAERIVKLNRFEGWIKVVNTASTEPVVAEDLDRRADQIPVEHWHEIIADSTLGDAILDRLVHNDRRLQLTEKACENRPPEIKLLTKTQTPEPIAWSVKVTAPHRAKYLLTIAGNRRAPSAKCAAWSSRNRVLQQRLSSGADTITILNVRIRELERRRDRV
jgi:ribosomal protein L11 methyltransferase PrmA/IstB-like ATP binding protein